MTGKWDMPELWIVLAIGQLIFATSRIGDLGEKIKNYRNAGKDNKKNDGKK